MTKFEEFSYNKRMNEFFEKVYNQEPIASLVRRNYSDTYIFIKNMGLCIDIGTHFVLAGISNDKIDFMAHLYASYQLKELENFIENTIKYSTYLGGEYSVNTLETSKNRHVFYNKETIKQFETYKKEENNLFEEDNYEL